MHLQIYVLALDLSHPTTPEVTPPNGTLEKKSHPTITGSHPKQVGPPWYTSFIYPWNIWNMVSWTREFWVYLWEVWWIVASITYVIYTYIYILIVGPIWRPSMNGQGGVARQCWSKPISRNFRLERDDVQIIGPNRPHCLINIITSVHPPHQKNQNH